MKKLFFVLLTFCISQSLIYAQADTAFEIKLKIAGINDGKGYMYRFYGGNGGQSDNNYEIKDGECIIKGNTDRTFVARIGFDKNLQFVKSISAASSFPSKASSLWLVIYPGAKFSCSGSVEGKDFYDIYPTDGGENDLLAELNQKMMPLVNKSINCKLEAVKNNSLTEENKKKLEEESNDYFKQSVDAKIEFAKAHPNSIAALWIMEDMLIRSEIDPLLLKPVLEKVDVNKYGTNDFYISLKARLEGADKTSVGKKCPDIQTSDSYDGQPFNLESMKGKFILIDFWGTWCGPCVAGIPKMKAFRDAHSDKVQILGISNDKDVEVWKKAIVKYEMNYPNILIGKGDKDFVSKFNVQGFPTKILISADGTIVYRETGENEDFYKKVEEIISK